MGAFLKEYVSSISEISLIPADNGRYEIKINDDLIYSKAETGRHAEPPEIISLFDQYLKEKA
jgi:predicted Rdx family selenoprotein